MPSTSTTVIDANPAINITKFTSCWSEILQASKEIFQVQAKDSAEIRANGAAIEAAIARAQATDAIALATIDLARTTAAEKHANNAEHPAADEDFEVNATLACGINQPCNFLEISEAGRVAKAEVHAVNIEVQDCKALANISAAFAAASELRAATAENYAAHAAACLSENRAAANKDFQSDLANLEPLHMSLSGMIIDDVEPAQLNLTGAGDQDYSQN